MKSHSPVLSFCLLELYLLRYQVELRYQQLQSGYYYYVCYLGSSYAYVLCLAYLVFLHSGRLCQCARALVGH